MKQYGLGSLAADSGRVANARERIWWRELNVKWFQNPDNISYVNAEEFIDNFAKETGISDLGEQI